MEGNLSPEVMRLPVSRTVTESSIFPVTAPELGAIRRFVAAANHQEGAGSNKFLLSKAGPTYHDPLKSYLATECLRKVDNPATVIRTGERVDPWVGAQIGRAKTAEEALTNDAGLGAAMLDRAERELGPDAPAILKSIQRKGINYPQSKGEYQRLYSRCVGFMLDSIREVSVRQGSIVALTTTGEKFRENTWRHLDESPDAGLIIPSGFSLGEPFTIEEVLPRVVDRQDSPWKKIEDYSEFRQNRLSSQLRAGLDFLTGLTPLGLRKVFAPALRQAPVKV